MAAVADLLPYLIAAALAAVVIVLMAGVFTLARGGEFGRKHSNRLMRMRVGLQALAVVLMLLFWLVVRG